ncbi:hypothetical protein D5S17_26855 [Pseudonocardiaceae bacterium YIM PH 21723]|nr:hypothetical protein D5S17_26855 [Pseudonocardiaceae bacterium YIM PH 21723]
MPVLPRTPDGRPWPAAVPPVTTSDIIAFSEARAAADGWPAGTLTLVGWSIISEGVGAWPAATVAATRHMPNGLAWSRPWPMLSSAFWFGEPAGSRLAVWLRTPGMS